MLDLKELEEKLKHQPIALDLETNDPKLVTHYPAWINPKLEGHIAGVCLATDTEEWYLPIGHENEPNNLPTTQVMEMLNRVLTYGVYPVIMHNAHYDYGWLKGRHHIKITRPLWDTMLGAPLINENLRGYSLDTLGNKYLGARKDETILYQTIRSRFHKTDKNGKRIELTNRDCKAYLWRIPAEYVSTYGKQDARLTFDLWKYQMPIIAKEQLSQVAELEMNLIEPLIDIRLRGIRIDLKRVEELKIKYTNLTRAHLDKLTELSGFKVCLNSGEAEELQRTTHKRQPVYSISSPTDMANLCNKIGVQYGLTELGKPSFSEESIPEDSKWFLDHLIKAKRYGNKVVSTYIEGYIEKFIIGDRIHAQFNQLRSDEGGTITGRFSSSNPNLQNIPARDPEIGPDLLSIFISDEGQLLWCADYSAQEPKMAVHLAIAFGNAYGDEAVEGASLARSDRFKNRNSDFHTEVATAVVDRFFKPRIFGKEFTFQEKLDYMLTLPWFYIKDTDTVEEEDALYKYAIKCFRTPAKEIGLGTMYGMGVAKLKMKLEQKKIFMSIEDIKELRLAVFDAVPFLKSISDRCASAAKQNGFVRTFLKRRGRFVGYEVPEFFLVKDEETGEEKWKVTKHTFADIKAATIWRAGAKLEGREVGVPVYQDTHKALNKIIQGSSADQGKMGVLHLYQQGQIPQIMVHDSVIMSIDPKDDPKKYALTLENCLRLNVESKIDYKVGKNWSEVK